MTSRSDALPKCGCGGEAKIFPHSSEGDTWVACEKCGASSGTCMNEEDARAAWTRAMSAAPGMGDDELVCFATLLRDSCLSTAAKMKELGGTKAMGSYDAFMEVVERINRTALTRRPAPQAER